MNKKITAEDLKSGIKQPASTLRRNTGVVCLLIFLAMVGFSESKAATTFHVATDGNNAWSGQLARPNAAKTDGPFASLTRARDAVRALKSSEGGLAGPVNVAVAEGVYDLEETLVLAPEDSGGEQARITYLAEPGKRVVLRGGRTIQNWRPWRDGIFRADLKAEGFTNPYFYQLFYKGERQILARYPDRDPDHPRTGGFLYVEQAKKDPQKRKIVKTSTFRYYKGDIPFDKLGDLSQVEIFTVYGGGWNTAITPITKVDRKDRWLHFKAVRRNFYRHNRYFIQNVLGALDSPGEWFHDRKTDTLYFYAPDGRPAPGDVLVPTLDNLVETRGTIPYPHGYLKTDYRGAREDYPLPEDAPPMNPVEHITFRGFEMRAARQNAFRFEGARRCEVVACRITNIGNYGVNLGGVWPGHFEEGNPRREPDTGLWGGVGGGGQNIWFNDPCVECRVEGNDIWSVGSDGVFLYGTGNVAENNHIYNTSLWHKDSACINLWGERNVARRNELHDHPRNVIYLKGVDNVVESNDIHHAMLESCDGGSIRMCQRNLNLTGNVIRHNRIIDSIGYGSKRGGREFFSPYFCWGIYLDDFTCGTDVSGNIVVNAGRAGIMVHGGSNNRVENNVLVDTGLYGVELAPIRDAKTMNDNRVNRNIILGRDDNLWVYKYTRFGEGVARFAANLVFNQIGETRVGVNSRDSIDWEAWMKRDLDTGSVVAPPALGDDYLPKKSSPAWNLGFQRIPVEDIGCYESPQRATWPLKVDPDLKREEPLLWKGPAKPPKSVREDFESEKTGARPVRGDFAAPAPSSIFVTDETAAAGAQSLKLTDAKGLRAGYLPRFFYLPSFTKGQVLVSMDVRLDARQPASVYIDPRQTTNPGKMQYLSGPHIIIGADGVIRSGGKSLGRLPLGEWVHIEMGIDLASSEKRSKLTITASGRPAKTLDVPWIHKAFSRLDRLVFACPANAPGVCYLDNIRVEGR